MRRRQPYPGAASMQARRTGVVPCLPALSATPAVARPDRRSDRIDGPIPAPLPGTAPSRRTPATRPPVRPRGPMHPPKTPAACCRTPRAIVLYSIGPPDQRVTETFHAHWPDRLVNLQQPMVKPLRGPWTRRVERSVSDLPVPVDAQVRHGRGKRPVTRMATRPLYPCGELLNRHLPPQLTRAIPVLGDRQVMQVCRVRPRIDQRIHRIEINR